MKVGIESSSERILRGVIADDHPIFCRGLSALLEQCGVDASVRVSTFEGLERELSLQRVDLVVLNTELLDRPLGVGLERITRRLDPPLVLAIHKDLVEIRQIMHAGARGCISKVAEAHEFLSAVRTVCEEGYYLDSRLGVQILSRQTVGSKYKLTRQEARVLTLIADGLTNRQIAERLNISLRTVESYRANLKNKTGSHDRSQLIAFARRHFGSDLHEIMGSCRPNCCQCD